MVLIAVTCPYCQSDHITKHGKTETDKQRYRCHNPNQTASEHCGSCANGIKLGRTHDLC
jgi:transposase-like protein